VISFAVGGAILLYAIYCTIENANDPWINKGLFALGFILPIGFLAFFLLGFGLYLLIKSDGKESATVTLE